MTVTLEKKRINLFRHTMKPGVKTSRVCSRENCGREALYVTGYYLVGTRRVRQWTCLKHWSHNPQLVLPTPAWVVAAQRAEDEHLRERERWHRHHAPPSRGVSVKMIASSGHGEPIPGDRVAAWRWGT